MKKIIKIMLVLCLFILMCPICYAKNINIQLSPQTVKVNGKETKFEVYNIDGYNYFKLRDIAYVLNNTSSNFSVSYDLSKNSIITEKREEYDSVGGELTIGSDKSSTAVKTSQKIIEKEFLADDKILNIQAYNIGGNNFFKLRDLGYEFCFSVNYDNNTNTVLINSQNCGYIDDWCGLYEREDGKYKVYIYPIVYYTDGSTIVDGNSTKNFEIELGTSNYGYGFYCSAIYEKNNALYDESGFYNVIKKINNGISMYAVDTDENGNKKEKIYNGNYKKVEEIENDWNGIYYNKEKNIGIGISKKNSEKARIIITSDLRQSNFSIDIKDNFIEIIDLNESLNITKNNDKTISVIANANNESYSKEFYDILSGSYEKIY